MARENVPTSWLELSSQLKIPAPALSNIARSLIVQQGSEPPRRLPPPHMMGAKFITSLTEVIKKTSITRKVTFDQNFGRIEQDKLIRECLDKHQKLLGNNLIEIVADELSLPIEMVQKCLERRYNALKIERRIREQESEFERGEISKRRAKEQAAIERADLSGPPKQAPPRPERPRPRVAALPAPSSAPETTPSPAGPPAAVDSELDGLLQAAWIAERAGIPNARRDAVIVLTKRFPTITAKDAELAIDAAYDQRSATGKAKMERRALRLMNEQRLDKRPT